MHLYEERKGHGARGVIVSLSLFAALLFAFLLCVRRADAQTVRQQRLLAEEAIRRAAITCYAVEGRYPLSWDYLAENYGVHVDEETYVVFYDAFASNVLPSIAVLERGDDL